LGKSRETALIPNKKGAALGFYATHSAPPNGGKLWSGFGGKGGDGQY